MKRRGQRRNLLLLLLLLLLVMVMRCYRLLPSSGLSSSRPRLMTMKTRFAAAAAATAIESRQFVRARPLRSAGWNNIRAVSCLSESSSSSGAGDYLQDTSSSSTAASTANPFGDGTNDDDLTILEQSEHYLVVAKPPSVVCHHSSWAGTRRKGGGGGSEVPALQRVRDQLGGRRVNLVHRLDRGASGCLLMTYAEKGDQDSPASGANATALLSAALADKTSSTKTYCALVRGEGMLHGRRFQDEGWFREDRPIKDEKGVERNATTWFRFLAGQDNGGGLLADKARASLVLARPETGRWHQIRKHLSGLSHPILGDSSHGHSVTNREWKERRGLLGARISLHLSRLVIGPVPTVCPDGIDVTCPLPSDMMRMLTEHLPDVLAEAEPKLREEGIRL